MSRGNSGVTLLEVVLSLAIGITAAVFAAEFFAGQLAWYGRYGKIREACILADRVSSLLEEDICFGFGFFIDPADPERLCYWTMEEEGRRLHVLEEMDVQAAAEAVLAEEFTEQAEIDQAWKDLLKVMSELRLKPSKEALEALVASAENLSVEGADEETAAVFRSALANAVSVLNDDQATEEEVASAGEELQAAMSRVLASAGGSTDKPDGNTDNGGQQGSGSSDNGTASAGGSEQRKLPSLGCASGGGFLGRGFCGGSAKKEIKS